MNAPTQVIHALTTLASLLQEQTERVEEASRLAHQLEATQDELYTVRGECKRLQEEISYQRTLSAPGNPTRGQANLFLTFLHNPAGMINALTYLREQPPIERSKKIQLIKEVRLLVGPCATFGLKEAKDFVEAFLEIPVPVPAFSDPNNHDDEPARGDDPNPCRDMSVLNPI